MSMEYELTKDIKKELRAAMNGVAAAQMRQAGMPYRLNFGVELPRLRSIAAEFTPDRRTAQALWNEDIRESKILAGMLMPADEFLPEVAEIWLDEAPTAEVVQMLCIHLLCRVPWITEYAFRWIATEQPMRQLAGYTCLARILREGSELEERSKAELTDQAKATFPMASLPVRKAIVTVFDAIGENSELLFAEM